MKLLIVGKRGGTNIGGSLERAARDSDAETQFLDSSHATNGPRVLQGLKWRLLDRRPLHWRSFGQSVVESCEQWHPDVLLTTGIAPVNADALRHVRHLGICRCNYLTDDPWSLFHRSRWFLDALTQYDFVFTPRCANIGDLTRATTACIRYLPFAYDEQLFSPVPMTPAERARFDYDVMFAGGADKERVPYLSALAQAGFRIGLYGSYWERFDDTRYVSQGQIDVETLRAAIAGARICLCLVRRANRDGHCMRTFEIPAAGGCLLAEDTEEHRQILGPDGECVIYFRNISEMIQRARWLLDNDTERVRLSAAARARIRIPANTYKARLESILQSAGSQIRSATETVCTT